MIGGIAMVDLRRDEIPRVTITQEMIDAAAELRKQVTVHRTKTSPVDTDSGVLGEFAFAQWFYGDWRHNEVGSTKGKVDFDGRIEVKTSVFPLNPKLNLPVREDYARKRTPEFYVWCCLDVPSARDKRIIAGQEIAVVGWIGGEHAHRNPATTMGRMSSYRCHLTPVWMMHPMDSFRDAYESAESS